MKRKHLRDYRNGWWFGRYSHDWRPANPSKWWRLGYSDGQVAQMRQEPVSAPPKPT